MKSKNNTQNLKRLSAPGVGVALSFLLLFSFATLYYGLYYLAAAEAVVVLVLAVYTVISRRFRDKRLAAYVESVAYETENAKNNTLMHFPLPIAVFRLDDSTIVWGNERFFEMCGVTGSRMDVSLAELLPEFSGKWLLEGKNVYPTLVEMKGRRFQMHGNLIRSNKAEEEDAFMGITYWVDVTEYDDIRIEYENSRPVPGVVVIDNLEELGRSQTERVRNELRDAVEDKLNQWCARYQGMLRRYDRDRFLLVVDRKALDQMKKERFSILEEVHELKSPNGVESTISIGLGEDSGSFGEGLQFADMAVELAVSRGGDQAVVKNRLSFEFFGGRGMEVEKRTKVKSRVMANTMAELIRDSSHVLVMGHKMADLDALGADVGVCCLARKCGVRCHIVIDSSRNNVGAMLERMRREPEYRDAFITPQDAMLLADGRTLLVIVDTSRPEQVEDPDLLDACNRVAVVDHHRVAATFIHNAALGFIEPYASSACELMTEVLREVAEPADVLRCEAEALLAGIVLDTKSFSIRTGERTFDAAAYLRRVGADTAEVKKLFQTDLSSTVATYKILQKTELYRRVAVAAPTEPQTRVNAARAADELLNISGVDASVVVAPDGKGNSFASARSIGELNAQILMEKLGGGGNRSAAAAQFPRTAPDEAVRRVYAAIDEYWDQK